MSKYHINKDGRPSICRAKSRPCPLGGPGSHFDTEEEAYAVAQKMMEMKFSMFEEKPLTKEETIANEISRLKNSVIKEIKREEVGAYLKKTINANGETLNRRGTNVGEVGNEEIFVYDSNTELLESGYYNEPTSNLAQVKFVNEQIGHKIKELEIERDFEIHQSRIKKVKSDRIRRVADSASREIRGIRAEMQSLDQSMPAYSRMSIDEGREYSKQTIGYDAIEQQLGHDGLSKGTYIDSKDAVLLKYDGNNNNFVEAHSREGGPRRSKDGKSEATAGIIRTSIDEKINTRSHDAWKVVSSLEHTLEVMQSSSAIAEEERVTLSSLGIKEYYQIYDW